MVGLLILLPDWTLKSFLARAARYTAPQSFSTNVYYLLKEHVFKLPALKECCPFLIVSFPLSHTLPFTPLLTTNNHFLCYFPLSAPSPLSFFAHISLFQFWKSAALGGEEVGRMIYMKTA
jgi:hypothetical protein